LHIAERLEFIIRRFAYGAWDAGFQGEGILWIAATEAVCADTALAVSCIALSVSRVGGKAEDANLERSDVPEQQGADEGHAFPPPHLGILLCAYAVEESRAATPAMRYRDMVEYDVAVVTRFGKIDVDVDALMRTYGAEAMRPRIKACR
jgi:hypothetical protein